MNNFKKGDRVLGSPIGWITWHVGRVVEQIDQKYWVVRYKGIKGTKLTTLFTDIVPIPKNLHRRKLQALKAILK